MTCTLCPRRCGVDRAQRPGYCGAGERAHVARAARHFWEEPCLSGERGSGAIFLCGCNLRCVFCQNQSISHGQRGAAAGPERLAELMLRMQELEAHNVNLVTPAPHVPLLERAIPLARRMGLTIPIVYNTNAYELVETLRRLEGLVEIYLPDLKYATPLLGDRYSGAADYFAFAGPAILEMQRQCGTLALDDRGMAKRGLLVRHLVLPGSVDETRRVLDFLAEHLPLDTALSLMGQYVPAGDALPPPLQRRLTRNEYRRAREYCLGKGFTRVYVQSLAAADSAFTPEFDGYCE